MSETPAEALLKRILDSENFYTQWHFSTVGDWHVLIDGSTHLTPAEVAEIKRLIPDIEERSE